MRADDFVLETISHFVKGIEGPPPVVPLHVEPEFETRLVSLCYQQQMSAAVSEALDELALPPSMSRVTVARIKNHARELEEIRRKRLQLLGSILATLDGEKIAAVVAGDAWIASQPGMVGELRSVERMDMLINERDWTETVGVLRGLGFVRSRIQPRLIGLGPPGGKTIVHTSEQAAAEALYYHQYYTPLVMHNQSGDQVQLQFRVIDVGRPELKESAWERVRHVEVGERPALALSREDQLIHAVVGFGTGGFVNLSAVMDTGFLVARFASTLDWEYLTRRLRTKGLYPAFYCSLDHVCNMLRVGRVMERLDRPSRLRRRMFDAWWRVGDVDYSGEAEPPGGRFMYGLVECGGLITKFKWLRHSLFPRPSWVKSLYGRPSNPLLRLKFLHDVRSGRRKGSGVHHSKNATGKYSRYE
jgi:hypothetical protein